MFNSFASPTWGRCGCARCAARRRSAEGQLQVGIQRPRPVTQPGGGAQGEEGHLARHGLLTFFVAVALVAAADQALQGHAAGSGRVGGGCSAAAAAAAAAAAPAVLLSLAKEMQLAGGEQRNSCR